jgi:predicted ABC-type ATPase
MADFHLLAGPNGVGKSSLYRSLVLDKRIAADAEFVNADLYERDHLQHIADAQARSEAARQWADALRAELLASGVSFVSETVFSHESKLDLIRDAQAAGFVVSLYVLCLDDPQQLLQRVVQRVIEGGHSVPPERVLQRYPRTVANLKQATRIADVAFLYDTSSDVVKAPKAAKGTNKSQVLQILQQPSARLIAFVEGSDVTPLADVLPEWVVHMLA